MSSHKENVISVQFIFQLIKETGNFWIYFLRNFQIKCQIIKLKHTCIDSCNNYISNRSIMHDNAIPSASINSKVDMIETGEFESDHEEPPCARRNEMLLNVHQLRNQLWDNASDGAFV